MAFVQLSHSFNLPSTLIIRCHVSTRATKEASCFWGCGQFLTLIIKRILDIKRIFPCNFGNKRMRLLTRVYGMVTQNYQCVQNHETWFTSRTHSSNYDGVVTMLDYVLINLNLCCIQWYKFRVCRGKGSRDTVTQIYSCDQNHEKWFISRAHSSISNGMSHYFYIPL